MPSQADRLEGRNVLLRQELKRAQAIERELQGQLAQVQKHIAAANQTNADMRATFAQLRQRVVCFFFEFFYRPYTSPYNGRCVAQQKQN